MAGVRETRGRREWRRERRGCSEGEETRSYVETDRKIDIINPSINHIYIVLSGYRTHWDILKIDRDRPSERQESWSREIKRLTDKQTNRQTDKQTNRQTDKQTNLKLSEISVIN